MSVNERFTMQVMAVVGGMATQKQERLLKKCPEIVVATPGRLWELIQEVSRYCITPLYIYDTNIHIFHVRGA